MQVVTNPNINTYRIQINTKHNLQSVDYVFYARDKRHLEMELISFRSMYRIESIERYNPTLKRYDHLKGMEAKYVEK